MFGAGEDPLAFSFGQILGGYELLGVLGEGGMGTVFLARHPRLPRNVALKVLHPALSRDPQFRARFEREASLAASLDHPNIVTVHDRGLDDGRLWISMQYAGRTNAADVVVADGPMDPVRAVHIVSKVGAALDHAHRVRLLHRDVKPANIMIAADDDPDEPERVLLTDFGIAKADDSSVKLTETGALLATFAYAAPEQIEGRPLDHRVDIYALGAVLFELLTGRQPFVGDSPYALMVAHLESPPPDPRNLRQDLPAGLGRVIAAAMAKDRDQRPGSGRALARAAESALRRAPTARRRSAASVPAPDAAASAPTVDQSSVTHQTMKPTVPSRDPDQTPATPTRVENQTPATPTNIVAPVVEVGGSDPTSPEPGASYRPAGFNGPVRPARDEPGASYRPAGFNGPVRPARDDQAPLTKVRKVRPRRLVVGARNPLVDPPKVDRRRLIAAAAALLLVVAGLGVWSLLDRDPGPDELADDVVALYDGYNDAWEQGTEAASAYTAGNNHPVLEYTAEECQAANENLPTTWTESIVPDVDTLEPDPGWTLSTGRHAGEQVDGDIYTVVVTITIGDPAGDGLTTENRTVHVAFFAGATFFFFYCEDG